MSFELNSDMSTHSLAGRSYYKFPCLHVDLPECWERHMLPGRKNRKNEAAQYCCERQENTCSMITLLLHLLARLVLACKKLAAYTKLAQQKLAL